MPTSVVRWSIARAYVKMSRDDEVVGRARLCKSHMVTGEGHQQNRTPVPEGTRRYPEVRGGTRCTRPSRECNRTISPRRLSGRNWNRDSLLI